MYHKNTSTPGGNNFGGQFESYLFSDTKPTDAVMRIKSWEDHQKIKQKSIFKNLKWCSVGPTFQGGRISSVVVHPRNPYEIYVAAGAGNLWKTTNNGTVYGPSSHTVEYGIDDPWSHIGGGDGFYVQIDPTNFNTVYYEFQFGNIMRSDSATSHKKRKSLLR